MKFGDERQKDNRYHKHGHHIIIMTKRIHHVDRISSTKQDLHIDKIAECERGMKQMVKMFKIVKETSPRNIKLEEFKVTDKYRTNLLGLNRYKTLM